MTPETCLLTNFIHNNDIVSTCDFIPGQLNKGTVIYEVVRVIDGIPLFYHEHIERLHKSLIRIGHELNISKRSLALRIQALIVANKLADGNIRFQFSYDNGDQSTFAAWVTPFFYPGKELYDTGATMATIVAKRENPNIKIYNPGLKNDIATLIRKNNNYEILLVNDDGLITEGSRSNIFFVKGSEVFTPTTSSVLPGVTRSKIFEIAMNSGNYCKEANIRLNSINEFDAAFITGTSAKVLSIRNINKVAFNTKSLIIKNFMHEYDSLVTEDIQKFSWESLIK